MVQSPSWKANWFAASQEIPRISRNPKVHYSTHKLWQIHATETQRFVWFFYFVCRTREIKIQISQKSADCMKFVVFISP